MAFRQIPTMTKSHHGGNLSLMAMVGFCHQHIPTIDNYNDEVANQVWLPMPTNLHCQQIYIYRFTTKKTKTSFIYCCIETRIYFFKSYIINIHTYIQSRRGHLHLFLYIYRLIWLGMYRGKKMPIKNSSKTLPEAQRTQGLESIL